MLFIYRKSSLIFFHDCKMYEKENENNHKMQAINEDNEIPTIVV